MKRILFFLILCSFSGKTLAQDYTPMLEIGKIWNMHHYDNLIPPNDYDFNITLNNLITVNGIEYFEASNGDLFREDITNKKIYQLENSVEELILDFDLVLGDDLISPLIFIDETTFSIEITEIGVATFYGIPNLKYYRTDCGEQIIEGIGVGNTGLFAISTSCSTVDFDEGDFLINMNVTEYIPMAVENANWVIVNSDGELFPPFNDDIYYGYKIKGDTLINNTDYKKVYKRGFHSLNGDDPEQSVQPPFIISNEYIYGALRDDLQNKKVYGITFLTDENVNDCTTHQEILMYDFSLNIGDSNNNLCIYGEFFTNSRWSNFYYNRNRTFIGNDSNGIEIEGIGNENGLFEYPYELVDGFSIDLYDFCIGEDSECFSSFLLSNEDYFTKNNINLFYNQTEKKLQITNTSNILEIEIYSVLGKKVIGTKINTSLDVSQLQKGVYFYSLSKNNSFKKGKILIY